MVRVWRSAALICVLAILVGCAEAQAGASPSPTAAPTAAPTAPPTAPSTIPPTTPPTAHPTATPSPSAPPYVLVKATDVCHITSMTEKHENGNYIITEHFSCTRAASDPRVSGKLEFDVDSIFEPLGAPTAHWQTDHYVLTNDDGVWQGKARGVLNVWPDIGVINYGRADYVGTGAYEGLRFTEVIAASDTAGLILGYITQP